MHLTPFTQQVFLIPITALLIACGGDGEPVSDQERAPGECEPGEWLDGESGTFSCATCSVGEYCAGGTSAPVDCQHIGLNDQDADPSTPCSSEGSSDCELGSTTIEGRCLRCAAGEYCPGGSAPAMKCEAGTADRDEDPTTPCEKCPTGTYCPAGGGLATECGEDTWDHDRDPATTCAEVTACARNEKSTGSDGLSPNNCEICPDNLLPSEPNGAFCDLFSINPEAPVNTYTVTITGAVIAPFNKLGEEWDADSLGVLTIWNQTAIEEVDATASFGTYDDAVSLAKDYANMRNVQLPEVYGDARLSVRGFPEILTTLSTAGGAQVSIQPKWSDSGFHHVPLTDDTRLLVSLYDKDIATPDAISYVMLTGDQLAEAAAAGESVAIPVWGDSGGRVMWLTLGLTREAPTDSNFAPTEHGARSIDALTEYQAPRSTTRTLWVHGLDFLGLSNVVLPYRSTEYWDKQVSELRGPEPVAVNYHGQAYVSQSNVVLQYELDSLCRWPESCYIACHSAGCAQTGYALSLHSDLGTRWNVVEVAAAGSAAGGSELAESGSFLSIGGDLTRDLRVATMRTLYDHNALGVEVASMAGAAGGLTSLDLPGQDDGAVAYHSAGGVVDAAGGPFGSDFGNPGDLSRYTLPKGYSERTHLFNGHWVWYRDDSESYTHQGAKVLLASYLSSYE